MSESKVEETTFLVNDSGDPVFIVINGVGSHANVPPLAKFIRDQINEGKTGFVLDFENCAGMDSTFMGKVISGPALILREKNPPGKITLCRLSERNLELVNNMGLNYLVSILSDEFGIDSNTAGGVLDKFTQGEEEHAKMLLEAHESLVEADEKNYSKFREFMQYLRQHLVEN